MTQHTPLKKVMNLNYIYKDSVHTSQGTKHASIGPNGDRCMTETLEVYHKNHIKNIKYFYTTTSFK
jgi:hypothetical protein